eukprot:CAMPEP_0118925408 /NCGR_PEP_ID=MMETSP1169-20130426/3296_1 /TAXON_ID=36882 /ORGANISM="Pyramimonas obovata, Strain CCMP722" /LENGTH=32 /DNA_ID= /DNA_START= /DNA_END= /DNA_ORIENTATION=
MSPPHAAGGTTSPTPADPVSRAPASSSDTAHL